MFNFARRQEVGRAAKLVVEVAKVVAIARGSHGWLWQLRFAQARAELACAAAEWKEALRLAETALQRSRDTGRVRYQALALKTRAQAVAALGHTPDAVMDLKNALDVTRPTGDPAMLLQIAAALLALEGDAALAQEASAAAERIRAALPTHEMRQAFEVAEPVRQLATLIK